MYGMSMPIKSGSHQAVWSRIHSVNTIRAAQNGLRIRRFWSCFLLNLCNCNDFPLMNKALRILFCWSAKLKNHYTEEGGYSEIHLLSQRSPKLKSKVVIIQRTKELYSAAYVAGITLSALHIVTHLVLLRTHLTDKYTEAQ